MRRATRLILLISTWLLMGFSCAPSFMNTKVTPNNSYLGSPSLASKIDQLYTDIESVLLGHGFQVDAVGRNQAKDRNYVGLLESCGLFTCSKHRTYIEVYINSSTGTVFLVIQEPIFSASKQAKTIEAEMIEIIRGKYGNIKVERR